MPDFPYRNPQGWQCKIGEMFVPTNVCAILVTGLKTAVKLDKQAGLGKNGATIRYLNDELGSFAINLTAWSQPGFDLLFDLCVMARKQKGNPLTVFHPLLDGAGINKMIVESIDWPEGKVEGGKLFAKLNCTEWAPPPPPAKAKASVATTPKIADAPDDAFSSTKKKDQIKSLPKPPSATKPKP